MEAVIRPHKDFDYGVLDSETRIVVQQKTDEIRGLMKRTATDIIEIGERLMEIKDRLGHGHFGRWLAAEFAWGERTAQRFMSVATNFKSDNVTDLIPPQALYLLSLPSTPEPAREEALERAEAGEPITPKAAKEIVEAHRSQNGGNGRPSQALPESPPEELEGHPTQEGEAPRVLCDRDRKIVKAKEETEAKMAEIRKQFGLKRGVLWYCGNRLVRIQWPDMTVAQTRKILTIIRDVDPKILEKIQ